MNYYLFPFAPFSQTQMCRGPSPYLKIKISGANVFSYFLAFAYVKNITLQM